jgi:hypothetical protein
MLSSEQRRVLGIALGDDVIANEIGDQIDSGGNPVAAVIAALGATSNLSALVVTASDVTDLSTSDTYTDAAVNAKFVEVEGFLDLKADNADVETLRTESEARLDAIEAKIDAILVSLKNAGLMASA